MENTGTPNSGQINQQFQQQFGGQQPLPNSTAILVLGILSIVFCWCYGIIGMVLGIIALVLSGKAKKLYEENPSAYTVGSFNNMKGGRICGIIGICLSALYLVFIVVYIIFIGAMFSMMPWDQMMKY